MFRIGSQPPAQHATPISTATSPQGGSGTSTQLDALMKALDAAIQQLLQQQGGAHATGGDRLDPPGQNLRPGGTIAVGTIGTHTGFGSGTQAAAAAPTTSGHQPKIGIATGTVGTQKHAELPGHHHLPAHRPVHKPTFPTHTAPVHTAPFPPQKQPLPQPEPVKTFPINKFPTGPSLPPTAGEPKIPDWAEGCQAGGISKGLAGGTVGT